MRSVADEVRDEQFRELQSMTLDERVRLALRLGERDLEFYMAANGVDRETAMAALRRSGGAGRTPSKCNDEL